MPPYSVFGTLEVTVARTHNRIPLLTERHLVISRAAWLNFLQHHQPPNHLQRDIVAVFKWHYIYKCLKVRGIFTDYLSFKLQYESIVGLLSTLEVNPGTFDDRDLSGKKYCPLHYAAERGHPLIIKILLEGGANPNNTVKGLGSSSLHLLADKWKANDNNNEDNFKECLDILLKHEKINIGIQNKNKTSSLYLAAVRGWEYMVLQLILLGANLQHIGRDNITDTEHINIKFPGLIKSIDLDKIVKRNVQHHNSILRRAMDICDIENFKSVLSNLCNNNEKLEIIDSEEDQGMTLLQFACTTGQSEFVEEILKQGADPLKVDKTNQYTPILYAAKNGYCQVVDILLKTNKFLNVLKQCDDNGETVIHKVVKQANTMQGTNYKRCLELFLEYKSFLDLDATDENGNTPLHHAALHEDQSFARLLLLSGAHLAIKNELGILAITNIKASILEDVFNNSIELNNSDDLRYQDFEVILNYRTLVPTNGLYMPETECLKFLSSSYSHRHLLRHPIINTFLSLKWQKISKYYTFNLVAYITYLTLLTTYILIFHGTIIEHDVSDAARNGSITTESTRVKENLSNNTALKVTLQVIIALITLCIGVKEFIQSIVSWHSYVTSFKNWLEVSIVIMSLVLLFVPLSPYVQQSLSAWIILFSWTIFILILGCHPSLAIYITMFRRVTHNFTKFIFLFSFMILAFSLSFYLIFQVDENFMTVPQTILKTIAMSTGELEYTDLPLTTFPVTSHILFVLFILFILMVIMNLINGLAVSDIHMIQKEAEIYSYKNRVELISYLESVFLTDSSAICKLTQNKLGCSISNPLMRCLKWLGPQSCLLLQPCLKKNSIKMFPNRSNDRFTNDGKFLKSHLNTSTRPTTVNYEICTCNEKHKYSLEPSHIESAMSVVLADKVDIYEYIPRLENRLAKIDQSIGQANVNNRVTTLEDCIEGMNKKIEKTDVTRRIMQIEDHLTNIDTTISSLTSMVQAVHNHTLNKC
ncbi:unnamed protein product, partial [Meganyctiphanes norvegica]